MLLSVLFPILFAICVFGDDVPFLRYYQIYSKRNESLCLAVADKTPETRIITQACNDYELRQRWSFLKGKDIITVIKNEYSGLYMNYQPHTNDGVYQRNEGSLIWGPLSTNAIPLISLYSLQVLANGDVVVTEKNGGNLSVDETIGIRGPPGYVEQSQRYLTLQKKYETLDISADTLKISLINLTSQLNQARSELVDSQKAYNESQKHHDESEKNLRKHYEDLLNNLQKDNDAKSLALSTFNQSMQSLKDSLNARDLEIAALQSKLDKENDDNGSTSLAVSSTGPIISFLCLLFFSFM